MPKTRKRKSYSKRRTASLQLDIETSTDKKEVTSDISDTEPNGCTSTNGKRNLIKTACVPLNPAGNSCFDKLHPTLVNYSTIT